MGLKNGEQTTSFYVAYGALFGNFYFVLCRKSTCCVWLQSDEARKEQSLLSSPKMSQLHLKRETVKSREAFSIGFISASVNTGIGHSQLSAKNKLRASAQQTNIPFKC